MAIKTEKDLSDNARGLWLKALSAVELKNYGYAVPLLQSVLKENPEFLQGRQVLRRAAIANTKGKKSLFGGFSTASIKGAQILKKDPLAAIEFAETLLATDPTGAVGNNLLKDAALALGHLEIAVFALETLAEANPKDTKLLHELGDLHYSHGNADEAGKIYTKIVEITPADLVAVKRAKDAAATNTMKKGGWDTAGSYRDLISNREEAVSLEQKSRVVKSEEMIEAQLAELHEEINKTPENIDLSRRIASLYEQKNDLATAEQWFEYASQLSKGSDDWLLRKVADLRLKQLENGIKEREEWLALAGEEHEDSARIRTELESMKKLKGDTLLEDARKRVDRNPTDLQFRFELGEQLMATGDFTAAIPELQKARNNPAVQIKALNLLGQCYVGKGMLDLAVKTFKDAAAGVHEMDAVKKDILYKLGGAYEQLGKKEESLECFKEIYEADYGYRDVAHRVESSYAS